MDEIGYEEVDDEAADFVIFNTCTIRENANQKLYGHLGHVKTLKNKNQRHDRVSVWLHDAGATCH